MTTPARTVSTVAALTSTALVATLVFVACEVPVPTSDAGAEQGTAAAAPSTTTPAIAPPAAAPPEQTVPDTQAPVPPPAPNVAEASGGTVAPSAAVEEVPRFTPFTVAPSLTNLAEVQRALTQEYPTVLRDAGIGGRVEVWFFIGEDGRVRQTQVSQSSGYSALDQAALNVAGTYRFSPALNREQRVPVWVSLPITFQVR
jgi:protein TonB